MGLVPDMDLISLKMTEDILEELGAPAEKGWGQVAVGKGLQEDKEVGRVVEDRFP